MLNVREYAIVIENSVNFRAGIFLTMEAWRTWSYTEKIVLSVKLRALRVSMVIFKKLSATENANLSTL